MHRREIETTKARKKKREAWERVQTDTGWLLLVNKQTANRRSTHWLLNTLTSIEKWLGPSFASPYRSVTSFTCACVYSGEVLIERCNRSYQEKFIILILWLTLKSSEQQKAWWQTHLSFVYTTISRHSVSSSVPLVNAFSRSSERNERLVVAFHLFLHA